MAAAGLADILQDFGYTPVSTPERPPFPTAILDGEAADGSSLALVATDAAPSLSDAVAAAEAATAERLRAEHEEALAAERENHAAEIGALQKQVGELIGATINAEMSRVQETITTLVTSAAARILGPVLTEDLQTRSVEALAQVLRETLSDVEGVRIKISGSLAMYEALCSSVGDAAARFEFSEGPSADLEVRIDDSVIETRLGEWSGAMKDILS